MVSADFYSINESYRKLFFVIVSRAEDETAASALLPCLSVFWKTVRKEGKRSTFSFEESLRIFPG